jgi:hypothetical protein
MTDVLVALINILRNDKTVNGYVSNRIYGEEVAREVVPDMPEKVVVIESMGGIERVTATTTVDVKYDVSCYGETKREARLLSGAVIDAFNNVIRASSYNSLIHSIAVSGGPMAYVDTDTQWPSMIISITVKADSRNI